MGLDKRYPAFLLILVVFLGFFLFTSGIFQKDPPITKGNKASIVKAPDINAPASGPKTGVKTSETTLPAFPMDINKANVQELMLLPGIGEKTAKRIVEKRIEMGGFKTVDDLTAVKWIGKVKLEKIRGLVTVSTPSSQR